MAGNEARSLQRALESLDLGVLYHRFSEEKLDADVVKSLTDHQLSNLGVATIGDRIRLREILGAKRADDSRDAESESSRLQENVGAVHPSTIFQGAVDYGGPRKEFFRLVLQQINQDYFDPVREWSKDYEAIGKIMALSMVQNGKLPRVMSSELVEEVFFSPAPRPFVQDLRIGLDSLGLIQLTNGSPTFMHLFTPSQPVALTHKMMTQLLVPQFSPEGSNRRLQESLAYSSFLKYSREAASGRRGPVSLGSILQFTTGTDEEPVLGYRLQPSICFAERQTFLPSANTCVNKLILAIPSAEMSMPSGEQLFSLFDYAFSNSYFGLE